MEMVLLVLVLELASNMQRTLIVLLLALCLTMYLQSFSITEAVTGKRYHYRRRRRSGKRAEKGLTEVSTAS